VEFFTVLLNHLFAVVIKEHGVLRGRLSVSQIPFVTVFFNKA
jgi:hypothetical protein